VVKTAASQPKPAFAGNALI